MVLIGTKVSDLEPLFILFALYISQ